MASDLPFYCRALGALLAMALALICPTASYVMAPYYQVTVYRERIERVEPAGYFGAI